MQDLPVYLGIVGFLAMGIGVLPKPRLVTAQFDIPERCAAGRNEVRAVYCGFGVMIAVVLGLALQQPTIRAGVLVAVAAALAGMAAGRVVCAVIARRFDFRSTLAATSSIRWPPRCGVTRATAYKREQQSFGALGSAGQSRDRVGR